MKILAKSIEGRKTGRKRGLYKTMKEYFKKQFCAFLFLLFNFHCHCASNLFHKYIVKIFEMFFKIVLLINSFLNMNIHILYFFNKLKILNNILNNMNKHIIFVYK